MERKGHAPVEERRRAVRVVVRIEATYGRRGTPPLIRALITEISTTGLRLRSREDLPKDTGIEILFVLPHARCRKPIAVRVRAVRVALDDGRVREYGCAIVDGDEVREELRRFVLITMLGTASAGPSG